MKRLYANFMDGVNKETIVAPLSWAENELQSAVKHDITSYRYPQHLLSEVKTVLREKKCPIFVPLFDRASERITHHLLTAHPELSYQGYTPGPPDTLKCLLKEAVRFELVHQLYDQMSTLPQHRPDESRWRRNAGMALEESERSRIAVGEEVVKLLTHDRVIRGRLTENKCEAALALKDEIVTLIERVMPSASMLGELMYPKDCPDL
jgi:hypothetical protein